MMMLNNAESANNWPAEVQQVEIPCSDGAIQRAKWYVPPIKGNRPLLVGLHTWSSTFDSAGGDAVYAEWCIKQGWVFIHPDFRGPNRTPEALGSDRAVRDVVESVSWAQSKASIDETRIYLVGVSGGGHMAMQMAGRHPEIWAGVSAWCGISDVALWYEQHCKAGEPDRYAKDIIGALGHAPTRGDPEAWKRSPLSSLSKAALVPLDIAHGIHDGRKGSVPFTHSLVAFNAVVGKKAALEEDAVQSYYDTQQLPSGWAAAKQDPVFGTRIPLFQKTHGNTRVTIFEGGHEIVHQAALNWLAKQQKGRPPVWEITDFVSVDEAKSESGK